MKRSNIILIAVLGIISVVGLGRTYATYGKGRLVVELTDPPREWGQASNVYIKYGKVIVHRANARNESGWFTVVDGEGWVDLSSTLNSSETLGAGSLRAGKYNLVRFEVVEAIATVGGVNYTAPVENGKLNIAITHGGVQIEVGQTSHLLIDITPKVTGSVEYGFEVVPAAKAQPKS
ncbi:MAG: DUF4382 domain-containing protein [Candidatus Bathyarchaeia archaeon]